MQIRETLDIQHVNLIDEQNARHEFGHTLIYVLVHHLVDLPAQLIYEAHTRLACTNSINLNNGMHLDLNNSYHMCACMHLTCDLSLPGFH